MKTCFAVCILALFIFSLASLSPIAAQAPIPIDVFAEHQRSEQTLTLYFTNPVSGLSTPVVLQGFRQNMLALEALTPTPNGILFINPLDKQVMLATSGGRVNQHPFIPQQSEGLVSVDWVLSPDRRSIVWVEIFPAEERWISNVYIADIDGATITQLPPLPPSEADPFGRVMPMALTNDRNLVFYDAAFPIESRSLTDYFPDYRDVHVYIVDRGLPQRLEGEPACPCGASIGSNGRFFLRLHDRNAGFELTWWNLDSNTSEEIAFVAPAFGQAGDFFIPEDYPYAFYTQAENLTDDSIDAQFALMLVDFTTRQQSLLLEPSAQRFKVLDVVDNGESVLLGDVYGGATYKLSLRDNALTLVSENTWLGTIYTP